ncbi:MAG TPA: Gfo/Idh/MocA family oxidoreductase [Polyangia bacterium]|nr:Gfo/Idh/MocA family oxidoreductase [Polyangia bacterium]
MKTRPRNEPIRYAVIGQGYFAQAAVLPAFGAARGCELRAIFSEDTSKRRALEKKYDAMTLGYDRFDAYLGAGEVDAVYVALPNDLHRDFTVRAARAGVHVLCEKPIGRNAADAEAMIAACDENDVKLMVAYRLHFEAATLDAIARIRRGELGRPRFFSSTFAMQVQAGNIRTKQARAGGPLLDLGIYCVNAARAMFGAEPVEVTAIGAALDGDPRFAEIDEQVAVLRFPDERVAQFVCSFGAFDHSSFSVFGEKGRLTFDPAYEYAEGLTMEIEVDGKRPKQRTFAKRDQVAAELEAFATCIREDKEPEPSGREGLADMRVLDAIQRAIDSHKSEPVVPTDKPLRPSKKQTITRPAHGMPPLVHAAPPGRG